MIIPQRLITALFIFFALFRMGVRLIYAHRILLKFLYVNIIHPAGFLLADAGPVRAVKSRGY
jgi:hypothetical protein